MITRNRLNRILSIVFALLLAVPLALPAAVFAEDAAEETTTIRVGWHEVPYFITDENGREYLIPAIPDVCVETDVAADRIVIRPLKGIFDDED